MKNSLPLNASCLMVILSFFFVHRISGNNIVVSNLGLDGQNPSQDYSMIKFDISWENSWRSSAAPKNWDAAWIFAKFRPRLGGQWKHCSLNRVDGTGTNDGHTVPAGAVISSSQDATGISRGVFLYTASDTGAAVVNYNNVRLRWNYGLDGLGDGDSVEISVFAIEMVYVPRDSFWLGGTAAYGSFYKSPTANDPLFITSEDTLRAGQTNGNLRWVNLSSQPSYTISAAYPKGFNAFYCMKYELTQEMWAAFLNHIPPAYATTRNVSPSFARNAISVNAAGVYSSARGNIPMAGLNAEDVLSFLDWAALRPMTDLEYEKACRGPVYPEANELAWGTNFVAASAYTLQNAFAANEAIATNYATAYNTGNAIYTTTVGGLAGPVRSGIFAAHGSNTGRITAGASYYGIMELSGNTYELAVSLESTGGRSFTAQNGDGALSVSGAYNTPNWGVCSDYAVRGGSYVTDALSMAVAARGPNVTISLRDPCSRISAGVRGVRTAP